MSPTRLLYFLGYFFILLAVLPSCSFQAKAKDPITYQFKYGRTAMLRDGIAYAPKNAPPAVKRAIAAGNRLQLKPYKWGGGHKRLNDSGYDCSGSVSYILREAGLLRGSLTSREFYKYGKRGAGRWITIYARKGHVFITVAGLRIDTGEGTSESGPRWTTAKRQGRGHIMRHPKGL